MRILHVSPYYEDAWGFGGIPRVASGLCRGLSRLGHRVTVLTTDVRDGDGRLDRRQRLSIAVERGGVQVRVLRNLSNALAYGQQLFLPLGLERFLEQEAARFDVAHLHACHNLLVARAAKALARAGVPYVLQPNGTLPTIEGRRLRKRLFDATLGRGLVEGASRVLAVSAAEEQQLLEAGVPATLLRRLPNPVDLDEHAGVLRGRFRQRLGLGPDEPMALFLGRLAPRKGVATAIEAVAALGPGGPRLVIAGNDMGAQRTLRRALVRTGLGRMTREVGLLRGRERLEALADADVVLSPGAHEVFGLVVVEAILQGGPVLVADDCGAAELVRETGGGLALPVGDAAALSRGIAAVLADPAGWRARVHRAQAVVKARFAVPVVAEALWGHYRELVEPGA